MEMWYNSFIDRKEKMIKLQEIIDKALLDEQNSRTPRTRSGKISPSSLGRCFKYQYWNRKNEPPSNPLEARTLRIFAAGKLFHNYVEALLPNLQKEVLVETDDIKGYADIVTEDSVVDIKSHNFGDQRRMWGKTYDIYKEKLNYWLQVALYAKLLDKPKCGLFFVSKDNLVVDQFESPTSRFKNMLEVELETLRTHWRGGLPKGEPRAYGGRECQYCNFCDKCEDKVIKEKK